jgi:hypothetical protein
MAERFRELLANRRFAILLIALLAFCLVGLIVIGVVFIFGLNGDDEPESVAQATTPVSEPTQVPTTAPTSVPADTATPNPTATLVPVETSAKTVLMTATLPAEGPTGAAAGSGGTPTSGSETGAPSGETATQSPEEETLAQTGVGWGLIIAAGFGLALLGLAARRLRLADQ